jgi:hypothetical protein
MDSLKEAIGDQALAQRWQEACLQLMGHKPPAKASPTQKARVLLHGLGRGRGLITSAIAWEEPSIGAKGQGDTDRMRGLLWRYLMAYTGGELMAKSVAWDGSSPRALHPELFVPLLNGATPLKSPFASVREAPRALQDWLATDEEEEAHLPAFLGLSDNHQGFSSWLVGEPSSLSDLQVLACLRHLVAHGTLSPTKALQWGLSDLYAAAPDRLKHLGDQLTLAITPT